MSLFCKRLKQLRMEHQLSTIEMGKILNVSHTTITRWESGEIVPSILHLINIAKYFEVSADYLLGIEE
ncbi:MAG: helix-turn-helix domain-containing protein [Clostridia bacterium]